MPSVVNLPAPRSAFAIGPTRTRGVRLNAAYGTVVAFLIVGTFFTYAVQYAFTAGLVPFPPVFVLCGIAILALPLALTSSGAQALVATPLMGWALADLILASLSFFRSSQSETAVYMMQSRFLDALFLGILVVLFSDRDVQRRTRTGVLACTCFAVAVNVYEFLHPGTFALGVGRSAGLYVNPNIAASAILAGLVLCVGPLRASLRPAFVALAGLGVFLTLSRGALLCWAVLVCALVVQRQLRARQLLGTLAILVAVSGPALVLTGQADRLLAVSEFVQSRSPSFRRVLEAQDVIVAGDFSARERLSVAQRAFAMFTERPLTGYGIGATAEWELKASTHNVYLRYAAEYGVLGLLLFAGLLGTLAWGAPRDERPLAINMVLFLSVWGLFSHNVLEEWHVLLSIALASCVLRPSAAGARADVTSLRPVPGRDGPEPVR